MESGLPEAEGNVAGAEPFNLSCSIKPGDQFEFEEQCGRRVRNDRCTWETREENSYRAYRVSGIRMSLTPSTHR